MARTRSTYKVCSGMVAVPPPVARVGAFGGTALPSAAKEATPKPTPAAAKPLL